MLNYLSSFVRQHIHPEFQIIVSTNNQKQAAMAIFYDIFKFVNNLEINYLSIYDNNLFIFFLSNLNIISLGYKTLYLSHIFIHYYITVIYTTSIVVGFFLITNNTSVRFRIFLGIYCQILEDFSPDHTTVTEWTNKAPGTICL